MSMEIKDIKAPVASCNIIAKIEMKSNVCTWGANNKYMNLELSNEEHTIKITLFGENLCQKVEKVQVRIGTSFW